MIRALRRAAGIGLFVLALLAALPALLFIVVADAISPEDMLT